MMLKERSIFRTTDFTFLLKARSLLIPSTLFFVQHIYRLLIYSTPKVKVGFRFLYPVFKWKGNWRIKWHYLILISFTFSSLAIEFYSERKLVKTACFLGVSESGENHLSLEKLIARESRTLCENKSPHFTFTALDFHCGFLPFLKMDARRRLNECGVSVWLIGQVIFKLQIKSLLVVFKLVTLHYSKIHFIQKSNSSSSVCINQFSPCNHV